MNIRTRAVIVLAIGLLIQSVGRMASIRDTGINAVLTGVGLVVLVVGLTMLWRSRGVGRQASR